MECTATEVRFDEDSFEELQGLDAASKKIKSVDFSDVRHLSNEPTGEQEYKLIKDSLQEGNHVSDKDIAAMKLYDATKKWKADPDVIDEEFYTCFVVQGNDVLYKAKKFVSMMTQTVDEVRAEMSNHMRKIATILLFSEMKDKNLDLCKPRVTHEYGRLLIGYKLLDACLASEQKEEL